MMATAARDGRSHRRGCVRASGREGAPGAVTGEPTGWSERTADAVARFGGSWAFIGIFAAFLVTWSVINALLPRATAFDPYPFIFLNLMLSLLAALQAPVIMMSQNRQAAKDRLMAANDYEVNLKAEIEIAALHEKLDAIRSQELATLIQRLEKAVTEKRA